MGNKFYIRGPDMGEFFRLIDRVTNEPELPSSTLANLARSSLPSLRVFPEQISNAQDRAVPCAPIGAQNGWHDPRIP